MDSGSESTEEPKPSKKKAKKEKVVQEKAKGAARGSKKLRHKRGHELQCCGMDESMVTSIQAKNHEKFLKTERLTKFANLEWKQNPLLKVSDFNNFIHSWTNSTNSGRCRGKEIKADVTTLRTTFQLPRGGEEISRRTNKEWKPISFAKRAERKNDRGYSIKLCRDEAVKERLEFLTHAMHWKKPRTEYPRFFIQILEMKTTEHRASSGFFHESFFHAMKRAKTLIKEESSVVVEITTHLSMIIMPQLEQVVVTIEKPLIAES